MNIIRLRSSGALRVIPPNPALLPFKTAGHSLFSTRLKYSYSQDLSSCMKGIEKYTKRFFNSSRATFALSTEMKKFKPKTHGLRFRVLTSREGLHRGRPVIKLTKGKRRISGRCRKTGRITVRGRGGGAKRLYRLISFKRKELFGEFEVVRLEYDPNRSTRIALVKATGELGAKRLSTSFELQEYKFSREENQKLYDLQNECNNQDLNKQSQDPHVAVPLNDFQGRKQYTTYLGDPLRPPPLFHKLDLSPLSSGSCSDAIVRRLSELVKARQYAQELKSLPSPSAPGTLRYALLPHSLDVGTKIVCGPHARIEVGNNVPLKYIPTGVEIFNVDLYPNRGGQIVRSAGTSALVLDSRTDQRGVTKVLLRLPSLEQRWFLGDCMATIGRASNINHHLRSLGKAGCSRWLGRRPITRGCAKNANDHHHGGKHKGKGGRPLRSWKGKPLGSRLAGPPTRKKKKPSDIFILKGARAERRRKKGHKG